MKIIDLTLTVSDKIPTFPGSPQPNFIPWEKHQRRRLQLGTAVFEFAYRNPHGRTTSLS